MTNNQQKQQITAMSNTLLQFENSQPDNERTFVVQKSEPKWKALQETDHYSERNVLAPETSHTVFAVQIPVPCGRRENCILRFWFYHNCQGAVLLFLQFQKLQVFGSNLFSFSFFFFFPFLFLSFSFPFFPFLFLCCFFSAFSSFRTTRQTGRFSSPVFSARSWTFSPPISPCFLRMSRLPLTLVWEICWIGGGQEKFQIDFFFANSNISCQGTRQRGCCDHQGASWHQNQVMGVPGFSILLLSLTVYSIFPHDRPAVQEDGGDILYHVCVFLLFFPPLCPFSCCLFLLFLLPSHVPFRTSKRALSILRWEWAFFFSF